jgi:hypothetical protein
MVLDVGANSLEFGFVPNPVIKRFIFPERLPDSSKGGVGVSRGNPLDTPRDPGQRHPGPEEHVHVIGHDHIGVKIVMSQLLAAKDGVLDVPGNLGVA